MTEDTRDEGTPAYSGPRRRRGRRGYEGQPEWKDNRSEETRPEEPSYSAAPPVRDADRDRVPPPEPPRRDAGMPHKMEGPAQEPAPSREDVAPRPEPIPRRDAERTRGGQERGRRGPYRREERRDEMLREHRTPRREEPRREEPGAPSAPDRGEPRREDPRRGESRREGRPPLPLPSRGADSPGPSPERGERPRRERDRRPRERREGAPSGERREAAPSGERREGASSGERREGAPSGDTPRELRRDRQPRGERRPQGADRGQQPAPAPRAREADRPSPPGRGGSRPAGGGGGRREFSRRGREAGRQERPGRGSASSALADHPLKPTSALTLPPKPIRVMIVGGGTGGHITPALSIGEALKSRNPQTELLFIGSDRGLEREIIGKAGFRLEEFSLQGLPTKPSLSAVKLAVQVWKAYRSIRRLIGEFKPDVVVGTGGYVMVPGALAAKSAGIPLVLQEQNSVPGKANRLLSRFATEIHIHFTESRRWFKDRGKLRLSGNPVRIRVPEGRGLRTLQKYRLQPDRKTVLILGGSQGAHSLNQAFIDMLPHFRNDRDVQFVIQTGKQDYALVLNSVRDSAVRVVVKSFLHQIEEIYGITNLVLARAGAMTVSEISACGLPSILVPYPHAADDHQTANARALSDKGAAVLLRDQDVSGERLAQEIRKLLADPGRLSEMGRFAYSLSRPDAARRIAESVERVGGGAPETVLNLPEEYDEIEDEEAEAKH